MGGKLYFGSQKVTPAIVVSSGPAEPVIDSLTITPSTSQQTITASGGVDGYSPITVNAVTSSIDANISAGNIKDGVSILGVTGSYQGGGSSTKYGVGIDSLLGDVDANGVLQLPADTTGDIVFTGVKDVSSYGLYYQFHYESNLSHAVSFPDLTTVSGFYGCANAFQATKITSVSLPKLTTVSGGSGCFYMFGSCTNITSVSLPELTTVSGSSGCNSMFYNCTNITSVSIPKLKTISGANGCNGMFSGVSSLTTITFDSLDTITGSGALQNCFLTCRGLSSVYFPSLTTSSFGSSNVNQFNNMFNTYTAQTSGACTVHFPSNLQSTISGLTGYPTFGGNASMITLAFDLTATS